MNSSKISRNSPLGFEVRKAQQSEDHRSLLVTIPNRYARRMEIQRGDLLQMSLNDNGRVLCLRKVDLSTSVLRQAGVTMIPAATNERDYTEI